MEKITFNEIKKILKKMDINEEKLENRAEFNIHYEKHYWDGGYESGHGYCGTRQEFYQDMFEMLDLFQDLICEMGCHKCIISPLYYLSYFINYSDLKEADIYKVIQKISRANFRVNGSRRKPSPKGREAWGIYSKNKRTI